MRSDTRRNFRMMLESARELFALRPETVTMPEVAAHAAISTATAYRYFPSMESLVNATVLDSVNGLRDFSKACSAKGEQLFREVMTYWVELVLEQGDVLVYLRSRRGYLERLQSKDPVITRMAEAWEQPVQEFLQGLDAESSLHRALMHLNQVNDPREILDLYNYNITETDDLVTIIMETFRAGVYVWLDTTRHARDPLAASPLRELPSESKREAKA